MFLSDTERVFSATQGQRVIFDRAVEYVDGINAEIDRVTAAFVERETSDFKFRYKLPGGGHLARRGTDGRYPAVRAYGYWDVAYPLEDFGLQIAGDDVSFAYMTVGELDNHLRTIKAANVGKFKPGKKLKDAV